MQVRNLAEVESLLQGAPTVRQLYAVWEQRQPLATADQTRSHYPSAGTLQIPWLSDDVLAKLFLFHALRQEEFLLVLDAAKEILSAPAGSRDPLSLIRHRIDYAIALTRLGSTNEARLALEPTINSKSSSDQPASLQADVLIQLGHVLAEEAHYASAKASQDKIREDALEFYERALQADPDRLQTMVLIASTAFLLANSDLELHEQALKMARRILERIGPSLGAERLSFEILAARATAHAILGQMAEAYEGFEQLQTLPDVTTGALAEARFQAQFLAEASGKPRDFFKAAFPKLQLIVFSGHLPDRSGRQARLPSESIPAARAALQQQLTGMGARVGLASGSAGADLLFLEALIEMGGTSYLVLPWSQEEFRRTSIRPYEPAAGAPVWEPLFDRALENARIVREIGQVYEPSGDVGWQYMMEVTAGIALQTARALRLDVQPVVFWDGKPGWGPGGTASFYHFWKHRLHLEPIVIPAPAVQASGLHSAAEERSPGCERPLLQQEVKSMLFADIVGYSKLTEKAVPEFIGAFLHRLGQLVANSRHAPCNVNTWGDALYAVFDTAEDAALFALEVTHMIHDGRSEWLAKGLYWESVNPEGGTLQHPLNIRIGLHTGPVVLHYDPVVRRIGFTGSHVNRAARIEPIAEHGQVFASEEFAAMAELTAFIRQQRDGSTEIPTGFVCEFAGTMQLAKGYPGRHRMYRIAARRIVAVEDSAKLIHAAYLAESQARGQIDPLNPAHVPWESLGEDLREANRAQVADISNKLRLLDFELASGPGLPPSEITISEEQLETLAQREHRRWMADRRRQGWTYATVRDNARKLHPLLVPWEELSHAEKEKDRDTLRNLPMLLERAGMKVRRMT